MKQRKIMKMALCFLLVILSWGLMLFESDVLAGAEGPVMVMTINGSINPATDDFLKTSLKKAKERNARLLVIQLNTPGGLLTSLQTMVESLLDSEVPTAVYVSPSGGGATSAGVFITLAGHVAAMAPGTTIGAAHPVSGSGQDIDGDMKAKVENFAVSLIKAVAEQRGRNAQWAEKAVRESVSITDREAVTEKVVDLVASDLNQLLAEIEGRTVNVHGTPITLQGLQDAPREPVEMSFKQTVINVLSDPNIAILLGLAAMLGIGIELYHPGGIFPGVLGVICLVLSLTASQVLPINYGGVLLMVLSAGFFVLELLLPSFGIWGVAAVVCLILGSIYMIDTDLVWGEGSFTVNKLMIGSLAGMVGAILLVVSYLALSAQRRQVTTGKEGLLDKVALVKKDFVLDRSGSTARGKVSVSGELWDAVSSEPDLQLFQVGDRVVVKKVQGLSLFVSAEVPNEQSDSSV